MPRLLSRKVALAELHCHLGGAVTPAIMWGIAHSQGIKLPTKDYWEFRDMITVSPRRNRSFDGYLQLFHWTELIQSSPLAVERAVYEVVGGAYRKNNVTTMELRFNPMKRNRGGEQDLDHIIAAAVRGMDKATLEYPVKPGLLFCLDRAFPFELNEIIAEKAIAWRDRGVVGIDIAGPESATFRVADYRRLFRRARQFGLGLTVHTGKSGPADEVARVVEQLEPDRIGHGVKAAYDPRAMAMIRDRGIVLEICPTSNLNTRVVSGWDEFRWIFDTFRRNEVRFTINTDGPRCSRRTSATRWPSWAGSGSCRSRTRRAPRRRHWPRRSSRMSPMCRRRASNRPPARSWSARKPRTRAGPPTGLSASRDPVRAAAIARRDVAFANDIRAQHVLEQVQLGLTGRRRALRDVEDRAVVLAQLDRTVRAHDAVGEVALGGLDLGQAADAVLDRGIRGDTVRQLIPDPVAQLAPTGGEDLLDELVATDRHDGRQEAARERVIGGREEVLGVGRDVVQVPWPPDAVLDGLATHEMGILERSKLLEDPGPARAEAGGELVRRARAVHPEADEEVAP